MVLITFRNALDYGIDLLFAIKNCAVINRLKCKTSFSDLRWRLNQGQLDSPTLSKGKLGDAICSHVFVSHHISSLLEYYVEIGNVTSRRSFVQGRNGRAYLFTNVVNVTVGVKEDRHLMTGLHTVHHEHAIMNMDLL